MGKEDTKLRIARTKEVIRNARTKLIYEKGWIAYGKGYYN